MVLRKIVSFLFIFILALSLSHAQIIPTGKLVGIVTDNNGVFLPGTTVTIKSPSLILAEMVRVVSESGYYKFVTLPSGIYQVTYEMPGMKTIIREGIVIIAGGTTTLYIVLEQTTIEESVTVVGKAPTVDLEKTVTGNTFAKDFLDSLPLTRNFAAIFNSAPGMFARTSHGSDARSNKFLVDGIMIQDVVNGDPIMEVGYEAIEEVLVDTGGHKAESGQVKGAVVQVLTKSGGNNLSGEAHFYFRNKKLQSDNTQGTPFEGSYVGFDYQASPSFSLGGPVKKDKLWFFASMNIDIQSYYIQGFPANSTAEVPNLKRIYGPFLKFTYQIDAKNKLVLSASWRGYYQNHRDASLYAVEGADGTEDRGGPLFTLQWTRFFTQDFLFNLKASFYNFHQTIYANNDLAPWRDEYFSPIINEGGKGSDWWWKKYRYQLNQDATLYVDDWMGMHEFKVGAEFQYATSFTDSFYYQDSRFDGWFPEGFKGVDIYLWNGVANWLWVGEELRKRERLLQWGVFVQDTWSPVKHLTLNLGLRYEYSRGTYPPQKKKYTDEWANQETVVPLQFNTISPRVGISFDPFGNGKTVFRAHYGRYYNPMNIILYWTANPSFRSSFWVHLNPDWTEDYRQGVYTPTLTTMDPDMTSPYADEINFGFEREIMEDFFFTATYIAKWEKNLIEDVDANHLDVDLLKETGELSWSGYTPVQGIDPDTGNSITFYEMDTDFGDYRWHFTNIAGTGRKYQGIELKLTKRMSRNWAMLTSYVYSKGVGYLNTSRDQSTSFSGYFDNPNRMVNAWGLLDFQRQHLLKVQGTYRSPLGIYFGVYYQFGSGVPYTRYLRNWEAGLGALYQGTVSLFAEPRGSRNLPDQHLLDIRIEKNFNLGSGTLRILADVYNVFNVNTATSHGNTTGVNLGETYGIIGPRYVMLGIVYRF